MRELYALDPGLPVGFVLGAPLLLSLGLASVFTFAIERPALHAIRQAYRKPPSQPPQAHPAKAPQ